MVVVFLSSDWRLLLEKTGGSDRMQLISGVEEAVVCGLSQSEGTPDTQTELKNSWNAWARKLCDGTLTQQPVAAAVHCRRSSLLPLGRSTHSPFQ